ncbi:MAG TPA: transglutaminase family protein [Tepidisphaeraceae bacterium]|nr:transglutaminase family protein [Tepidisphaeraceae bacterium]
MLIKIGYDLEFELPAPTPMLLLLYVHPQRAHDLNLPNVLLTEPQVSVHDYIDVFGNRCARVVGPAGKFRVYHSNVIRDSGEPEFQDENAIQHPLEQLPADTLQYLLASRYCEVDRLTDLAWKLFGEVPQGWARVKAVTDWVHQNVTFGYQYASHTKTAWQVYTERTGVCRDFMHLAITFLRCLNIPARYATGYLGDIGVAPAPEAMDFSAYFEVYLSNTWWPVDARHNQRRIGRVLMARGRDAVDVALATSFGPHKLTKFVVVTEEIK